MNQLRQVTILSGNILNKALTFRKGTDASAEEVSLQITVPFIFSFLSTRLPA